MRIQIRVGVFLCFLLGCSSFLWAGVSSLLHTWNKTKVLDGVCAAGRLFHLLPGYLRACSFPDLTCKISGLCDCFLFESVLWLSSLVSRHQQLPSHLNYTPQNWQTLSALNWIETGLENTTLSRIKPFIDLALTRKDQIQTSQAAITRIIHQIALRCLQIQYTDENAHFPPHSDKQAHHSRLSVILIQYWKAPRWKNLTLQWKMSLVLITHDYSVQFH